MPQREETPKSQWRDVKYVLPLCLLNRKNPRYHCNQMGSKEVHCSLFKGSPSAYCNAVRTVVNNASLAGNSTSSPSMSRGYQGSTSSSSMSWWDQGSTSTLSISGGEQEEELRRILEELLNVQIRWGNGYSSSTGRVNQTLGSHLLWKWFNPFLHKRGVCQEVLAKRKTNYVHHGNNGR